MTQPQSPKGLVEASLAVSLTVVLYILSAYVPAIGIATRFVVPIPIIVTVMRRGLRVGIMASVVSAFLIGVMTTPFQIVDALFNVGLVGLVMGGAVREGEPPVRVVLYGAVASFASLCVLYLLGREILGVDPVAIYEKAVKTGIDSMGGFDKRMGMPESVVKDTKRMLLQSLEFGKIVVPGASVLISGIVSSIHYFLTRRIMWGMGTRMPGLPGIRTIAFPKGLALALIGGVALGVLGNETGVRSLVYVGANVGYTTSILMFVQGLGVVLFAGQQGPTLKLVLVFLLVWNPFLLFTLLVVLGCMDTFRDFRKLKAMDKNTVD